MSGAGLDFILTIDNFPQELKLFSQLMPQIYKPFSQPNRALLGNQIGQSGGIGSFIRRKKQPTN
jgi:hypothetical protein